MDKEFLEDYKSKEMEQFERFMKGVADGRFTSAVSYPPRERFVKANDPMAVVSSTNSNIWPQIPLFGSLVIPLFPRRKDDFSQLYAFDPADIKVLVDLSRDTGRVQFALGTDPTHFANLDYLDPIFIDLEPPMLAVFPLEHMFNDQIVKKYSVEFLTLAGINFIPKLNEAYRKEVSGITIGYIWKRVMDYQRDYVVLKALGYEDIVTRMSDALVSDISEADRLFQIYGNFISEPWVDQFRTIPTRSLEDFKDFSKEIGKSVRTKIPCEIGKFLMRKLTLFPEGYHACVSVMDTYKQEDLQQVMNSLISGLESRNIDVLKKNTDELSVILDNIWADAKRLFTTSSVLRYGIPINIALIGEIIGMLANTPLGGLVGLLAGLGYKVIEESIKIGRDRISDRIAMLGEPNYISAIFDFQKRNRLR